MDTSTEGYLAFVVLGALLVVVIGQILTRGGKVYLEEVFADSRSAGSVSTLLSVLFYLFALGILGVISSMTVPVDGTAQTVVTKLGVVLLVLGTVFGLTMLVLSRIRARRAESEKEDALIAAMPGNGNGAEPGNGHPYNGRTDARPTVHVSDARLAPPTTM